MGEPFVSRVKGVD